MRRVTERRLRGARNADHGRRRSDSDDGGRAYRHPPESSNNHAPTKPRTHARQLYKSPFGGFRGAYP